MRKFKGGLVHSEPVIRHPSFSPDLGQNQSLQRAEIIDMVVVAILSRSFLDFLKVVLLLAYASLLICSYLVHVCFKTLEN